MDLSPTLDYLRERTDASPELLLILGSGWGALADSVQDAVRIPFNAIPGFSSTDVTGHAGMLHIGQLEGVCCIVFQGRYHLYEGHPLHIVTLPVQVASALGAHTLIATNAAGGVNRSFQPGQLMPFCDHINLMGQAPDVERGPGFSPYGGPAAVYDSRLITVAESAGLEAGLATARGVYCAVTGPSFETPAEIRMIRRMGGDAVGMSTLPETLDARARGLRVLAVSLITNMAAGTTGDALTHEGVLGCATRLTSRLVAFLRATVSSLPPPLDSGSRFGEEPGIRGQERAMP